MAIPSVHRGESFPFDPLEAHRVLRSHRRQNCDRAPSEGRVRFLVVRNERGDGPAVGHLTMNLDGEWLPAGGLLL